MTLHPPAIIEWLATPAVWGTAEAVWAIAAAIWILLERRPPASTVAWILAMAAMPVVGAAVYLVLGPRRFDRKKLRLALLRRARTGYLDAWEEASSRQLTRAGQLARLAVELEAPPPETARSVALLATGDAFVGAVVDAIDAARHHVHAEFYIYEPDRAGRRVRDALAAAARRGVQVRLLVDDAGSASLRDRFLAPLREAGGVVERFNPVLIGRLRGNSANFRTHRKIVVCDGRVGFTGGMNVSDDQSASASGEAAWRDTAVRIEGSAVHGLQLTFLENWAFASGASLPRGRDYFPEEPPGPHDVQIVPSGPDQDAPVLTLLHVAAIGAARERVWVTTPYFVPDEPILAALQSAALRGVDVRLLVPRRTDARVVDAAGRTFHDGLAAAGVKLHLYGPPMLHAKTLVVDRELAIVGTANLDNRSLRLNFEVTAILYGAEAAGAVAAMFEEDLRRAAPPRRREADGPFLARLGGSVARLLASQL